MAKATTRTSSRASTASKAAKSTSKAGTGTPSSTQPKAAAKTATDRKSPPMPASKAAPVVVTQSTPVLGVPDLKKIDLIDAVVERSGIKKKFAKPVIEAALAVLGETLAEGRSLNLRPLGKVKIQRTKDVANGKIMTVRVRQPLENPKVEKSFLTSEEDI